MQMLTDFHQQVTSSDGQVIAKQLKQNASAGGA